MHDPSVSARDIGISQVEEIVLRIGPDDIEWGTFLPALRALEAQIRMREETSPFVVTAHVPASGRADGSIQDALVALRRTIAAEGGVLRTVWSPNVADVLTGESPAAV